MIPDRLILTPEGEAALLSASEGGVFIRPSSFVVGNFSGTEPETVSSVVLGDVIYSGQLFYVEVLNGNTARFTVELPVLPSTVSITEMIVYLDDNVPLGRVRTTVPYEKAAGRRMRLSFMLHLDQDLASVIDVTLSTFGSVPAVAGVDFLPPAGTAITNAVLVLDLQSNPDGEYSPEIAYRYGAGGNVWGFSGYSRLHSGNVNPVDGANFSADSVVEDFELISDDEVICSISAGKGAGETRRFKVVAGAFAAVNIGFSDIDSGSVMHIWKQIVGAGSSSSGLPDRNGVGPDWVLAAGEQNAQPRWIPQSVGKSRTRGNIYNPPGKLKITQITLTPTQAQRTFLLYNEDPLTTADPESWIHRYSYRKNNNYSMISLSGANQQRTAYTLANNRLEFTENVPVEATIDARLFELEPNTGSRIDIRSRDHTGDGVTREFDLPAIPEDPTKVLTFFERTLTNPASYTIDLVRGKIVFLEAIGIGLRFEVNVIVHESVENFATLMHSHIVTVKDRANVFVLPFTPSSKENVFINVSGLHVYKSEYVLVGNKVVMNNDVDIDVPIEFMIFENVRSEGTPDTALRGMVVDAMLSGNAIEMIRSGADSLRIELPEIKLLSGKNCKIAGQYPEFEVSFDGGSEKGGGHTAISLSDSGDSVGELTLTHRIDVKRDLLVNINAHFEAQLGPGFKSSSGIEEIQFALGFKTLSTNEPEFGRNLKGTGTAGFAVSAPDSTGKMAMANGSVGDAVTLIAANNPQGFVEIIAKVKIVGAELSSYESKIRISLNGIVVPIIN